MTIIDQSQTPVSNRLASIRKLTSVNRVNNSSGYIPIGISLDRTTFYYRRTTNTGLFASTDGGVTISLLKTLPFNVQWISELPQSGEVLIHCANSSGSTYYVYKSSGWKANKATATFAQKLTGNSSSAPHWSLPQQSVTDSLCIFVEYGNKTSTGAIDSPTNTIAARRAFRSVDGGETWELAYDMLTDPQSAIAGTANNGNHLHSGCVYNNRATLSYGDSTGNGAEMRGIANMQLIKSESKAAINTWDSIPQPSDYQVSSKSNVFQVTALMENEKNIIAVPDANPYGIMIIPKLDGQNLGKPRFGPLYTGSALATGIIGWQITRAFGNGMPIFATAHVVNTDALAGSNSTNYHVRIFMSDSDGTDWYEAYTEIADGRTAVSEPIVFGPDVNGNCIWQSGFTNGGAWTNGALASAKLTP